jgi:hypothetical protein
MATKNAKTKHSRAVLRFVRCVVAKEPFGRGVHHGTIQAALDAGLVTKTDDDPEDWFRGLYPYAATAAGREAVGLPADKGVI